MGEYATDIQARANQPDQADFAPEEPSGSSFIDRLRRIRLERPPGAKEVYEFTSQLAVMMQAGIQIRDAMTTISTQLWANHKFRKILARIRTEVEAGESFSTALSRHGRLFDAAYVNMVRAAELSGNFSDVLSRLADYLDQRMETRSMVRGAMAYPAIIFTMAVAATVFCLAYVLPKFGAIFAGKEHILPAPTKALLTISHFFQAYWYAVVGGGVILGLAVKLVVNTPAGRARWDALKLHLPVLKGMLQAFYITVSLKTLGELVIAGVPILEALSVTAESSHNTVFKRMWRHVHGEVKAGNKIAGSLREQSVLPESVIQMAAVGEDSGTLGEVLGIVATYYARKLRAAVKAATSLIEPLMIVAMGGIVGFIAMSILLPIFKMSKLNT